MIAPGEGSENFSAAPPMESAPSSSSGANLPGEQAENMDVENLEMFVEPNPQEERESLQDLLIGFPHLEVETWDEEKVLEATRVYEMFLVSGASELAAMYKIVELYSPPRVTEQLDKIKMRGMEAGSTFDLRPNASGNAYDLTKASDRAKVRSILRTEKPYIVIGSPPCTEFSQMQRNWNHHRLPPEEVRRRLIEAQLHLAFSTEISRFQMKHGRHFLPWTFSVHCKG